MRAACNQCANEWGVCPPGSQPDFEPARRLYASFGFARCGPFDHLRQPRAAQRLQHQGVVHHVSEPGPVRPLAYVEERDLIEWAQLRRYPIIPCNLCGSIERDPFCPANGQPPRPPTVESN